MFSLPPVVSDIVSPSVSSEDPLGFLSKEIFVLQNFCSLFAIAIDRTYIKKVYDGEDPDDGTIGMAAFVK